MKDKHNSLHLKHIYSSDDELYSKLKKCLLDINGTRKFSQKKIFTPYDWKSIIKRYDQLFDSFIW